MMFPIHIFIDIYHIQIKTHFQSFITCHINIYLKVLIEICLILFFIHYMVIQNLKSLLQVKLLIFRRSFVKN